MEGSLGGCKNGGLAREFLTRPAPTERRELGKLLAIVAVLGTVAGAIAVGSAAGLAAPVMVVGGIAVLRLAAVGASTAGAACYLPTSR